MDEEENAKVRWWLRLRLILVCIVRVTGGRRSLCKFFPEKPGWSGLERIMMRTKMFIQIDDGSFQERF